MKFDTRVDGLKALDANFRELPKATGKNVLRRVGRQALAPMLETARELAPDDPATGPPYDLKTSLTIAEREGSRGRSEGREKVGDVTLYMGPSKDGYPQAMIAEFGAGPHYVTKGAGRRRGKVRARDEGRKMHPGHPATPYMRPAWDRHWRGLLESLRRLLAAEIEKAVARLRRKAERAGR